MPQMDIEERRRKIVSCSALGILHTNTSDILEPPSPDFDIAFVKAFRSCGLEQKYPRVIAVTSSSKSVMTPSSLLENSCSHQWHLTYARWASYRDSNMSFHRIVMFTSADQMDMENDTKEASELVDEIAEEDPNLCDWDRWELFGEVFLSELLKK